MSAKPHPAKYSDGIVAAMAEMLLKHVESRPAEIVRVLDPFAGTGRIHELDRCVDGADDKVLYTLTLGVEIEPEWAAMHRQTIVGDATALPESWTGKFGAICTSPCVTPDMRVLTSDLRWVPAGDLRVGDRLLTFNESSPGRKVTGESLRRRFEFATVTRAGASRKPCVRVILANDEVVTCSVDHPWLAVPSGGYRRDAYGWIKAGQLRPGALVCRQFDTWRPHSSWDAGWVAGMFDGEGSLAFGQHGSPKLQACQVEGPTQDAFVRRLRALGHPLNTISRRPIAGRQPITNTYVVDGWPGLVRALGQIRPERLLSVFEAGDLSSRTVQPERVAVVAVEDIGEQEIAEVTTTSGTYITEGYLHHNTYGNRMADHHDAKERCKACAGGGEIPDVEYSTGAVVGVDQCEKCKGTGRRKHKRLTYRHQLGRPLHANNTGQLQWGKRYRAMHERAWSEAHRVLHTGGLFLLNCSDHIRKNQRVAVTDWHVEHLCSLGFQVLERRAVDTKRMRYGANRDTRVDHEELIALRKAS